MHAGLYQHGADSPVAGSLQLRQTQQRRALSGRLLRAEKADRSKAPSPRGPAAPTRRSLTCVTVACEGRADFFSLPHRVDDLGRVCRLSWEEKKKIFLIAFSASAFVTRGTGPARWCDGRPSRGRRGASDGARRRRLALAERRGIDSLKCLLFGPFPLCSSCRCRAGTTPRKWNHPSAGSWRRSTGFDARTCSGCTAQYRLAIMTLRPSSGAQPARVPE